MTWGLALLSSREMSQNSSSRMSLESDQVLIKKTTSNRWYCFLRCLVFESINECYLQFLDPNELGEYNVASGSALPGSPEHTPAPGSPERTPAPGSPPADENDSDSDGDELDEQMIKAASFGDECDKMDPYYLERMHNPPNEALVLDDPDVDLSIQNFLAVSNASEMTYK